MILTSLYLPSANLLSWDCVQKVLVVVFLLLCLEESSCVYGTRCEQRISIIFYFNVIVVCMGLIVRELSMSFVMLTSYLALTNLLPGIVCKTDWLLCFLLSLKKTTCLGEQNDIIGVYFQRYRGMCVWA